MKCALGSAASDVGKREGVGVMRNESGCPLIVIEKFGYGIIYARNKNISYKYASRNKWLSDELFLLEHFFFFISLRSMLP